MLPDLSKNEYFTAGFFLLLTGGIVAYLKNIVVYLFGFFLRTFFVEVELSADDTPDAYRCVMQWIAEHPENVMVSERLNLVSEKSLSEKTKNRYDWDNRDTKETNTKPPRVLVAPGSGLHIIKFNGRYIFVTKFTEKGEGENVPSKDKMVLYTFGKSSPVHVTEFVDSSIEYSWKKDSEKLIIYDILFNWHPLKWGRSLTKPKRKMESVILDNSVTLDLIEDVKEFINSSAWYKEKGVPFRRSYLLHGHPGCGKTSFVSALAGYFNLNVCVLSLSDESITDSSLSKALGIAPNNSIILLEDIDASFPVRPDLLKLKKETPRTNNITFSGVLNAIDGISSQEGRIIIMTTNHFERVTDPALLRPGRIDKIVCFNLATKSQARGLFLKFYPDEEKLADKFSEKIPDCKINMAQLQGHCVRFKQSPISAVNHVDELLETVRLLEEKFALAKQKEEDELRLLKEEDEREQKKKAREKRKELIAEKEEEEKEAKEIAEKQKKEEEKGKEKEVAKESKENGNHVVENGANGDSKNSEDKKKD